MSGQYTPKSISFVEIALEESKALIDSGANSKELRDQEEFLIDTYKYFSKTGLVVINRMPLTESVRDAHILAQELDNEALKLELDAAIVTATKVLKTSPINQATLNEAEIALITVMNNIYITLEKIEQTSVLIAVAEALLDGTDVGNKESQTPQSAVDTFASAIATAKGSRVDGILSDADIETLQAAMEAFKASVISIDKTELEALIHAGKELDLNIYDADTVALFKDALVNAQTVMDTLVSVDEYNASLEALDSAFEGLQLLDKCKLDANLATAKDVEEGIYTDVTYKALQTAIAQAQAVYDKSVLTQVELDDAEALLQEALNN